MSLRKFEEYMKEGIIKSHYKRSDNWLSCYSFPHKLPNSIDTFPEQ